MSRCAHHLLLSYLALRWNAFTNDPIVGIGNASNEATKFILETLFIVFWFLYYVCSLSMTLPIFLSKMFDPCLLMAFAGEMAKQAAVQVVAICGGCE